MSERLGDDVLAEIMFAEFGAIWPIANTCRRQHQQVAGLRSALIAKHLIVTTSQQWNTPSTSRLPNGRYHGLTSFGMRSKRLDRDLRYKIEYVDNVPVYASCDCERDPSGKLGRVMEYVDGVTYEFSPERGIFGARIALPIVDAGHATPQVRFGHPDATPYSWVIIYKMVKVHRDSVDEFRDRAESKLHVEFQGRTHMVAVDNFKDIAALRAWWKDYAGSIIGDDAIWTAPHVLIRGSEHLTLPGVSPVRAHHPDVEFL